MSGDKLSYLSGYTQTSKLLELFICNLLSVFQFEPYQIGAGVVKCVLKPRCAIGARMQVAHKMSVDFSYVDGRTHEPTGDRRLFGCLEGNT